MRTLPALLSWLLSLLCLAPAMAAPPPLMLASDYRDGINVADHYVSEKLDGVRGYWDGDALWTRGGHRIEAPTWFTAGWPAEPMDGELWIERGRFEDISGIVRTRGGGHPGWKKVRFMVFDLPAHGGAFSERLAAMRALMDAARVHWLRPVEQRRVTDDTELHAWMDAVVAGGGEGLMLHHHDSRYRAGRSSDVLKLKPHQDAEAEVIGYTAGRGKYTGMVGALVMQRPDGLRFRIGSGLSDALRAEPPPLGSHVTYRYNGLTANGMPRFARFLRVRDELPPPDPE